MHTASHTLVLMCMCTHIDTCASQNSLYRNGQIWVYMLEPGSLKREIMTLKLFWAFQRPCWPNCRPSLNYITRKNLIACYYRFSTLTGSLGWKRQTRTTFHVNTVTSAEQGLLLIPGKYCPSGESLGLVTPLGPWQLLLLLCSLSSERRLQGGSRESHGVKDSGERLHDGNKNRISQFNWDNGGEIPCKLYNVLQIRPKGRG